MLASLVLCSVIPSSIDSTGVRARYVLPSVDGGFFRTTDLHCLYQSEVTDGEELVSRLVIRDAHHEAVSHDFVLLL